LDLALAGNAQLLVLAKHYAVDPASFARHALRLLGSKPVAGTPQAAAWDVVVIGGGLAGLTTALVVLDRGGSVVLLEKEAVLGGNSQWASSGINGVLTDNVANDTVALYTKDCESGGKAPLIPVLTEHSGAAIEFLRTRGGVELNKVGQLGGHSAARTYRPTDGLAGQELVFGVQRVVKKFPKDRVKILTRTRATSFLTEGGRITGVKWKHTKDGSEGTLETANVVVATGGFASGGETMQKYRPDLVSFPTTNGLWATGEGHSMAEAVGATTVGMKDVQVHPTAFVDAKKPEARKKTLCAEILRGVGGLLLDRHGRRFANELGKRDYLTARMLHSEGIPGDNNTFTIVLNGKAAAVADKHVPFYSEKGLLRKFEALSDLAAYVGVGEDVLLKTFKEYNEVATSGEDEWGKKFFHNTPYEKDSGPWFAGHVTPALHYTMGGIKVNEQGEVLRADGTVVTGLYAAGESVGGVHGENRLGGNALTECAVFGRLVGQRIQLNGEVPAAVVPAEVTPVVAAAAAVPAGERKVTRAELAKHASKADCWVSLYVKVYDFTDFLEEHPAGEEAILEYGGKDGTEIFDKVHTRAMLDDFDPLGELVD